MSEAAISSRTAKQLARLALRLGDDSAFMSSALAAYQKQERLSDDALASQLQTDPTALSRLALCKRPSTSTPEFADQVRQISTHIGIDAGQLAMIIRQVEALERLRARPQPSSVPSYQTQPATLVPGLLAAARDQTDTDESEAPASGEEGPEKQD